MTNPQMKRLTKIRLINWHYFVNETIQICGSALFSGENASGKSTILDAIQFVLTANARNFNSAANESHKRDLRGYVRCKTGEEGNAYIRSKGSVISYVALEFYEESKDRYFVVGVKLDSPDIESDIIKKWFCVEGKLDSLRFVVDGRPADDKDFLQDGKKVQFERQVKGAQDVFRARLGRLDDKFPDMLAKSMAFRPISKVKEFIYKFILPESEVKTDILQENIRNLREMQKLVNDVRQQIEMLRQITDKADEVEEKEYNILVIRILIAIANVERLRMDLSGQHKLKSDYLAVLAVLKNDCQAHEMRLEACRQKLNELNAAINTSELGRLIESTETEIRELKGKKAAAQRAAEEFDRYISDIERAVSAAKLNRIALSGPSFMSKDVQERIVLLASVKQELEAVRDNAYMEKSGSENELANLAHEIGSLENKIAELRKKRMLYDENTEALRRAINEEFQARKIESQARVFADLLEISLPQWRDAVEGYLNTQRFYIIVEPAYYDIAAAVYDRMKGRIHSAGLVNTGKLLRNQPVNREGTLAEAVQTENRHARAYADYILGRVICCETVEELKQHSVAITRSCMKYQGHVLSKIAPEIYADPYIGRDALRVQLENSEKELRSCNSRRIALQASIADSKALIDAISCCEFAAARDRIDAADKVREYSVSLQKSERELEEAKDNPTFIDLKIKLDAVKMACETQKIKHEESIRSVTNKERDIEEAEKRINELHAALRSAEEEKEYIAADSPDALAEAERKYQADVKRKTPEAIASNYGPRKQTLQNQREDALTNLVSLQARFKDGELGTGMEVMPDYREELYKLEKSDLIAYEGRLCEAQDECEIEFRENFLVKMRENIERAQAIFSQLNKSLKGIYYGNDAYKFELSASKDRQSLYDMIMSDINIGGQSLFTASFEEKYHAEMEDLFAKLTDKNLADSSVIKDLTDYRAYLDYDIKIISREGRVQLFSKTYGEKSGGETQTPYYVAIAASFAQLYSGRETARIVLLDEAFNNMDEDRIESMMQFFKSQNFQIILAAPPARMEIIGEHVDSIYLTIRQAEKNVSVIEEYFL